MSKLEEAIDDYSTTSVPDDHTVSGLRIAVVITGVAITIPGFLLGAEIGASLGLFRAFPAIILGGLVLGVIGSLTGIVGAVERKSTYKVIETSFGVTGAKVVTLIISLTMLGWYGVTASLFGQAAAGLAGDLFGVDIPKSVYIVLGSILMTLTAVFGYSAIERLSFVAVPPMLIVLVTAVYLAAGGADPAASHDSASALSFGSAVSIVVGGFIVGVTLFPDLARFARNGREGALASFGGFWLGGSFVFCLASIPAALIGSKDLIFLMSTLGLAIPALAILILASWTTNTNNLYSVSLGLRVVFPDIRRLALAITMGVAGTGIALSGLAENLIAFMSLLSVTITPISGIYVTDFLLRRFQPFAWLPATNPVGISTVSFSAWILASAVGLAAQQGLLTLTGVPGCDAIVVASLGYALIRYAEKAWSRTTATDKSGPSS